MCRGISALKVSETSPPINAVALLPPGCLVARKKQASTQWTATRSRNRDSRLAGNLTRAAFAPQLCTGFVQEAITMEPTARQLSTMGVERDLAGQRDVVTAFDEATALPLLAEAKRFEPCECDKAEAVIKLGDVDIGGTQICPAPTSSLKHRVAPSWSSHRTGPTKVARAMHFPLPRLGSGGRLMSFAVST